jgi:hypothetical protein
VVLHGTGGFGKATLALSVCHNGDVFPDFVPILAARFAAEAVGADGLSPEARSRMILRLVRMALPNPTAADTVLGRLILSTPDRPEQLPLMLRDIKLPDSAAANSPANGSRLGVLRVL